MFPLPKHASTAYPRQMHWCSVVAVDAFYADFFFVRIANKKCRPLPAAESRDVKQARRAECRVVSAHLAFEEWDNDTVGKLFQTPLGFLPQHRTDHDLDHLDPNLPF